MHRGWYFLFGIVGGIVVGVLIARDASPSQPSRSSAPATTVGSARSARVPLVTAARATVGSTGFVEPEVAGASIVIPVPARLGGDKPVSTATAEVADRLGL